jgi:copper resistance protein B
MATFKQRSIGLGAVLLVLVLYSARPAGAQGIRLEELREMMSWGSGSLVLVDELEYTVGTDGGPVGLESLCWYGSAVNRLWFRVEGEQRTTSTSGDGEVHLYYGRLVAPFWDALVGARVDGRWGVDGAARIHLAAGLVGLAPLRFELSPTLFVSHQGDVSFRVRSEYQILVTQRLVIQPAVEVNAAVQEVADWGVGRGLNDVELGLRLRYEIWRELAPYVGVLWLRRIGDTADLARNTGELVSETSLVLGLRFWR